MELFVCSVALTIVCSYVIAFAVLFSVCVDFLSSYRVILCNWEYTENRASKIKYQPVPKADCVHMSAVKCGCTCGLFRLLLQCINGVFGFTCHLCVYPFCCQSVCFCACAHFNHCSLYMLKTRPSSVVIFSQLHRLRRLRDAANALSHTQKGSVWRNADRRVSTIGSFSLIAVLCTTCSEMLIKRFTCRTSQTAEH